MHEQYFERIKVETMLTFKLPLFIKVAEVQHQICSSSSSSQDREVGCSAQCSASVYICVCETYREGLKAEKVIGEVKI